jgi:hypothetical protein
VRTIFERNRLLFLWKNITDPLLVYVMLLWFPLNLFSDMITARRKRLVGLTWAITRIPAVMKRRWHAGKRPIIPDRVLLEL